MREQSLLELIELVYAAACDPAEWPRMLSRLNETMQGAGATLCAASRTGTHARLDAGVGIFGREFQQEYPALVTTDPFYLAGQAHNLFREGIVALGEAFVPMTSLERTDFYNTFGRQHGYVGGITGVVASSPSSLALVSVSRRPGQSFDDSQGNLMRALMPHFMRALQVHLRLIEANARELGLRNALDRLATGAVLVSISGRPLFVNRSARETVAERDGVILDGDVLRAAFGRDTARLHAMIAGAAATANGDAVDAGGLLLLERPSGKRPLQLVVSALPRAEVVSETQASAIVFINDPDRAAESDLTLLRRFYGLSRAEADVASLLVQDHSIADIGGLLGVSANTVRFHLKQLFAKTGTHRQGELIRLLLTTLQVRRNDPA